MNLKISKLNFTQRRPSFFQRLDRFVGDIAVLFFIIIIFSGRIFLKPGYHRQCWKLYAMERISSLYYIF